MLVRSTLPRGPPNDAAMVIFVVVAVVEKEAEPAGDESEIILRAGSTGSRRGIDGVIFCTAYVAVGPLRGFPDFFLSLS